MFNDLNFRVVLDHISDGVYVLDPQRNILHWNRSAERLTGYAAGEVVGLSCKDNLLVHIDDKWDQAKGDQAKGTFHNTTCHLLRRGGLHLRGCGCASGGSTKSVFGGSRPHPRRVGYVTSSRTSTRALPQPRRKSSSNPSVARPRKRR